MLASLCLTVVVRKLASVTDPLCSWASLVLLKTGRDMCSGVSVRTGGPESR